MKNLLKAFFVAVTVLTASLPSWGQAKIYTKKARMEDFTTRTTKVVITSASPTELLFKTEVASRWRVSPFEFCTEAEYESLKKDNGYYFLRMVSEDGLVFMVLTKGGKENEQNNLKKPFEVVRLPLTGVGNNDGNEVFLTGPMIDILQNFAEEAMNSDRLGYAGLMLSNLKSLKGKTIYMDPDDLGERIEEGAPDTMVAFSIAPLVPGKGKYCFKILLDTESGELAHFIRCNYRKESDSAFSAAEMKQFESRNAVVIR